MVNQQLVDYVKQQVGGGVSGDAVRKALLDAGWPEADVDDSMKMAAPAAPAAAAAAVASSPAAKPATQSFDPVSAMGSTRQGSVSASTVSPVGVTATMDKGRFFNNEHAEEEEHGRPAASRVLMIVMGSLIIVLVAVIAYIYLSLNGKLEAVTGTSSLTASEAANLKGQIQTLTSEKDALTGQLAAQTGEKDALAEELAFLAVTGAVADVPGTVKGTVSAASGVYTVTTPHNIRIVVKNSKDAKVDAALKPLVGNSATLAGTHRAGTMEITVVTVNGASLTPPAPTPTSTPSSTPPTT